MTDWTDIVRSHGPLVWRTAWRLLQQEADVADVYQETCVSAVKLSRRESVVNWPAMLRHLATARALERLRQRRRRDDCFITAAAAADHPGPRHVADPLLQAEASELSGRLRVALAQLPAQQAEVFCLRCLEEMTYEQIATRLSLSVSHVGVLLNRARQRLRLLLGEPAPASKEVPHD